VPRPCTVCSHPRRTSIDKALVGDMGLRKVSEQFGNLSVTSLHRHKEAHLPASLTKAQEAEEVAKADNLLAQVRATLSNCERLYKVSEGILARAVAANNLRTALDAIRTAMAVSREQRGGLELLAKLLGELNESPQVNVLVAPQWVQMRVVLMEALQDYPEARATVAQRLGELEAGGRG
jgi:hypothetical protein